MIGAESGARVFIAPRRPITDREQGIKTDRPPTAVLGGAQRRRTAPSRTSPELQSQTMQSCLCHLHQ